MQISAMRRPAAMLPRHRLPASISVSPGSPRATAMRSARGIDHEPFDQHGGARVHAPIGRAHAALATIRDRTAALRAATIRRASSALGATENTVHNGSPPLMHVPG